MGGSRLRHGQRLLRRREPGILQEEGIPFLRRAQEDAGRPRRVREEVRQPARGHVARQGYVAGSSSKGQASNHARLLDPGHIQGARPARPTTQGKGSLLRREDDQGILDVGFRRRSGRHQATARREGNPGDPLLRLQGRPVHRVHPRDVRQTQVFGNRRHQRPRRARGIRRVLGPGPADVQGRGDQAGPHRRYLRAAQQGGVRQGLQAGGLDRQPDH